MTPTEKMKTYKLKYWYLATGMEGIPQEYPEMTIKAEDEEHAHYEYFAANGINFGSFEEFMSKPEHVRTWGTTCTEVKDEN